jgi:DNA repair ATPase RecN
LTGQIKQLEREGERNIADLKEAREKIRELQNQLIDSQHETEKAREEEKKMKEEFEK